MTEPARETGQSALFPMSEVTPEPPPSPDFDGITFHEIRARTLLNRVPEAAPGGMGFTLNPYRGCTHACTYCFARDGHHHLGHNTGQDFQTHLYVKTNAAQVLRRELRTGETRGQWVTVGTSTDCYQRAEGRYQLMPDILRALTDYRVPFTTTTKSALLRRDIPHAGDHPDALNALVDACAQAGAVTVYADILRISPGTRTRFHTQTVHTLPPHLHQQLAADYHQHPAMPPPYIQQVTDHIRTRAAHHGIPSWEDYIKQRSTSRSRAD
ncbi:hypothetical protein ACFPFX_34920 [Streptomyces mauvecolor]|uniref:Radical SAM protein n=1 Tax=Streptomyces mauvecolor TaxID=58345 RepID=A0ABV9UZ53_9ACTN